MASEYIENKGQFRDEAGEFLLGAVCRAILSDLDKLHKAGIEDPDAFSCLTAYYDNPEEPGADGVRAKSVLEKK